MPLSTEYHQHAQESHTQPFSTEHCLKTQEKPICSAMSWAHSKAFQAVYICLTGTAITLSDAPRKYLASKYNLQ